METQIKPCDPSSLLLLWGNLFDMVGGVVGHSHEAKYQRGREEDLPLCHSEHASVSLQPANLHFEVSLLVFELHEGVSEDELLQQHHYVAF